MLLLFLIIHLLVLICLKIKFRSCFSYNSLLWDEILKQKNIKQPNIKISSHSYTDYEFFKFQVPLTFDKISSSYFKLMELCTHSKLFK